MARTKNRGENQTITLPYNVLAWNVGRLQMVLDNLFAEQAELEHGIDTENPFLTAFREHENINELTRDILIELIDHIKIYEGGNISVKFKFADELRRIAEYVQINTKAAAV